MTALSVSMGLDAAGFISGVRTVGEQAERGMATVERAYRRAAQSQKGLTDSAIAQQAQTMRNIGVAEKEITKYTETAKSLQMYKQELARVGSQYQGNAAGLEAHLAQFGKQNNLLSRATIQARELAAQQQAAAVKTQNHARAAGQLEGSLGGAISKMRTMLGVMAGFVGFNAIIGMADDYSQMASRLRNATQDTEEYRLVQERTKQTADITYRALGEAQEGFLAFSGSMKALGYSTTETLDLTDSLSFAFTANAARADQARSAQDALAKSLAKGRVDADAWMSIITAADNIPGQIARATGKTEAEIRKLGASGKLALQDMVGGIIAARDENLKLTESMSTSWRDGLQRVKNSAASLVGALNESNDVTGKLAGGLILVADNIHLVAGGVATLAAIYAGHLSGSVAKYLFEKGNEIRLSILAHAATLREAGAVGLLTKAKLAYANASKIAMAATGVGLVVALGTAIYSYLAINDAASKTTDTLADQITTVDQLTEAYKKQNKVQQEATRSQYLGRLADAQDEYDAAANRFYNKAMTLPSQDKLAVIAIMRQVQDGALSATDAVEQLRGVLDLPPNSEASMALAELAVKAEESGHKVNQNAEYLKALGVEAKGVKTSIAAVNEETAKAPAQFKNSAVGAKSLADGLIDVADNAENAAKAVQDMFNRQAAALRENSIKAAMMRQGYGEQMAGEMAKMQAAGGSNSNLQEYQRVLEANERLRNTMENQRAVENYLSGLEEQKNALGKSNTELLAMQMAAKGATGAEIAKAQAMQGVIDKYREQEQVMATLSDLDKQVAQLGMSDMQRQLDDLRRKGADGGQLAHAEQQLRAIEAHRKAGEQQRQAASGQMQGAVGMLTAAGGLKTGADIIRESAITFDSASQRLAGMDLNKIDYSKMSDEELYSGKANVRFGAAAEERRRRESERGGMYGNARGVVDLSTETLASLRRLNPNASVDAVSNSMVPVSIKRRAGFPDETPAGQKAGETKPTQSFELVLKSDGGQQVRGTLLTTDNFPDYVKKLARDMG